MSSKRMAGASKGENFEAFLMEVLVRLDDDLDAKLLFHSLEVDALVLQQQVGHRGMGVDREFGRFRVMGMHPPDFPKDLVAHGVGGFDNSSVVALWSGLA